MPTVTPAHREESDTGRKRDGVTERAVSTEMVEILRQAMPFQVVSDEMLRRIAAFGRTESYPAGAVIYDVGGDAQDICIIKRGEVEHALEPHVNARNPVQVLKAGGVFGWA